MTEKNVKIAFVHKTIQRENQMASSPKKSFKVVKDINVKTQKTKMLESFAFYILPSGYILAILFYVALYISV